VDSCSHSTALARFDRRSKRREKGHRDHPKERRNERTVIWDCLSLRWSLLRRAAIPASLQVQ
jgi:hypothetical protein